MATTIVNGDLATKQTLYSNKMIAMIKEDPGNKLEKYLEKVEGEGGRAEFYRIGPATKTFTTGDISSADGTDGSVLNLYMNDGDADTSESFSVEMVEISSGENISKQKVASTKLGVSDAVMKKHMRMIGRKKDAQVIAAIEAVKADSNYTAKIEEIAITGAIADDATVKALLGHVAQSVSESEGADEHRSSVAVLMNSKDHGMLYQSDRFTSSDFSGMVNKNGMKNIFSAEFVSYKGNAKASALVPEGTIYIVPSDTIGLGITPGAEEAELSWNPGVRKYSATVAMMRAVAVLDPESIKKIVITATQP